MAPESGELGVETPRRMEPGQGFPLFLWLVTLASSFSQRYLGARLFGLWAQPRGGPVPLLGQGDGPPGFLGMT